MKHRLRQLDVRRENILTELQTLVEQEAVVLHILPKQLDHFLEIYSYLIIFYYSEDDTEC